MPILIGIDEAGYGPLLGPLVVTSAAFSVPEDVTGRDLWRLLEPVVAQSRRGAAECLLVADSKAVYTGGRGLDELERTVLAFLGVALGSPPRSLRGLLAALCEGAGELCAASWWNDVALPCAADPERVSSAPAALPAGVGFRGLAAQVVRPGRFNALVDRHGNKSVLLFLQNTRLIERAMARFPGDLTFVIDKHGGRHYYGPLLADSFFGHRVHPLRETPTASSYDVVLHDRVLHLEFVEKADRSHLPAALASMAAKYVRELFMMGFNAYWCGRVDGLAPTAGYAADSRRFLAAIAPLLEEAERREIVRER